MDQASSFHSLEEGKGVRILATCHLIGDSFFPVAVRGTAMAMALRSFYDLLKIWTLHLKSSWYGAFIRTSDEICLDFLHETFRRQKAAWGLRRRNTTKILNGAINEIYNLQKDFDEIISITGGQTINMQEAFTARGSCLFLLEPPLTALSILQRNWLVKWNDKG